MFAILNCTTGKLLRQGELAEIRPIDPGDEHLWFITESEYEARMVAEEVVARGIVRDCEICQWDEHPCF